MSSRPAPTLEPAESNFRARLQLACERFLQPAVLIRVVLYLTTIVYLRTIPFDFVYDDNSLIILNPWMESWKYVPAIFTHSFWGFTDAARGIDFYRPLVMLVFASVRHLLGPAPGWFHLVAVGIHVLATYLTYVLAVQTTEDKRLAAIAAGIFGLHPTKVETAAWISGISDSLCVVFFLGSMIGYFKWRRQRETGHRKYLFISLTLLLLALFSKEAAIFAPVLIGIYEFASGRAAFRDRCRATFNSVWPFAAVTILAIAIRTLIVRIPTGRLLNDIPFSNTLLTAPEAILWYLGKQLWPRGLSPEYSPLLVTKFSLAHFLLPLCALLALTAASIWAVRKSSTGIFFTSWFVLMLAPVILYQIRLQQHDRYFYLASVATSIAMGYLITQVKKLGNGLQAGVIVVIFAGMAAITLKYSSYWETDPTLFTRAVQIAPYNSKACRYMAGIYINSKQPEKAEVMARNLISDPNGRAIGWYILGSVRLAEEDYKSAREAMQKAVEFSTPGNNLLASVALADVDMLLNRNEEAVQIYRAQLKQYPEMPYLNKRLASAFEKMSPSQKGERTKVVPD